MKTTRFTDEEIIRSLQQAKTGVSFKEIAALTALASIFYKWRSRFVGKETTNAVNLRDLEEEYNKLKKLLV